MHSIITVDKTACTACGLCSTVCTHHLPFDERGNAGAEPQGCIGCLHCYRACSRHAIRLNGNTGGEDFDQGTMAGINEQNLLAFMARRTSTRMYRDREVPRNILEKLTEAARYIPSGGNAHACEITVITLRDTLGRLRAEIDRLFIGKTRLLKNPLVRILAYPFADRQTREFLKKPAYLKPVFNLADMAEQGGDPIFYNAPAAVIIHSEQLIPTPQEDSVLATYNMVLMGQALGLGSCYVSMARNALNTSGRCRRIAAVPDNHHIHAVLLIGYPRFKNLRIPRKGPGKVHWVNEERR